MPKINIVSSVPISYRHNRPKRDIAKHLGKVRTRRLLDKQVLEDAGINSEITKVQSAVPRLISCPVSIDKGKVSSAFLISQDGFLLTVEHAIPEKHFAFAEFIIKDVPQRRRLHSDSFRVRVIERSKEDELALLVIDPSEEQAQGFPFVRLSLEDPRNGEKVYTLGHGGGKRSCYLTSGEVLTNNFNLNAIPQLKTEKLNVSSAIATTNPTTFGDSGGILCNRFGEVYGIVAINHFPSKQHGTADRINSISRQVGRCPFEYIPENPPRNIVFSIKIREQILPFLKRCGVDIDGFLKGNPIRSSNKIRSRLKRLKK